MQALYLDAMSEIDCIQTEYGQYRQISQNIEDELSAVIRRLEDRLCREQLRNVRQNEVLEKKIGELNSQVSMFRNKLSEAESDTNHIQNEYQQALISNKSLEHSYKQLQGYMQDLVENIYNKPATDQVKKRDGIGSSSDRYNNECIQIGNITSSREEIDECKKEINSIYQELGLHHMFIPRICKDLESYNCSSIPRNMLTSDRQTSDDEEYSNMKQFKPVEMIKDHFDAATNRSSPEFGKFSQANKGRETSPSSQRLYQDTPGFKIEVPAQKSSLNNEINVQPFGQPQDCFITRKKNEIMAEFSYSLAQIGRSGSKSPQQLRSDNKLKQTMANIEKVASLYKASTRHEPKREYETNISTAQGSIAVSNKEKIKKSVVNNSCKMPANENKENYSKQTRVNDTSSIVHEGDSSRMIFSRMASFRGILDPLLKLNSEFSNVQQGEFSSSSTIKFSSLVSDVNIEDTMFSLGAKPL